MIYKGKVTVTYQAGGALQGEHITEESFFNKEEAIAAAKELGSQVEGQYSTYSNMEYEAF